MQPSIQQGKPNRHTSRESFPGTRSDCLTAQACCSPEPLGTQPPTPNKQVGTWRRGAVWSNSTGGYNFAIGAPSATPSEPEQELLQLQAPRHVCSTAQSSRQGERPRSTPGWQSERGFRRIGRSRRLGRGWRQLRQRGGRLRIGTLAVWCLCASCPSIAYTMRNSSSRVRVHIAQTMDAKMSACTPFTLSCRRCY